MKIGILTFHRAINFGAVLQASAFVEFIQKQGQECEIIDFIPNNEVPKSSKILRILHYIKFMFTLPKSLKTLKKERRFVIFREKYCKLSEKTYFGDQDIQKEEFEYDLLISGSDQILNMTLTGNSTAFYLDFARNIEKISYASSFGRNNISEEERDCIKKHLARFSAISVREKSAGEIIEKICGRKAPLVLDPVFLLDKAKWDERCNENLKLPARYIFVYSMEVSNVLEKAVLKVYEKVPLPIIVVRGGGRPGRIFGVEDMECGPAEFLRYVRDAEMVITNSFHGIAMSLIYKKKFLCIAHSTRNTRIENIMEIAEKKCYILYTTDQIQDIYSYVVNMDKTMEILDRLRYDSIQYLKNEITKNGEEGNE